MKIIIISDSHGNVANLKHVLGFAKKIKAGAVIHCGDWDNLAAVEAVLSFGILLYSVLGNADIHKDEIQKLKIKSQKFSENFLKIGLGGRKIGVTHQYQVSNVKYQDVLFCGHRHRQWEFVQDGVRIVNPGALRNEINFAIYDTDTNKVEFIHD